MPKSSPLPRLLLASLLACYLIWGSTYLAIRFALESFPPFWGMGTRFLVAGSLLMGWMLWREGRAALPAPRQWLHALVIGAMMLGGVVQMLSPQPAGLARKESADNKASYAFGGVTNTASQGYPVPLLYGKRRIGGAIISAGIYVEDHQ